MPYARAGDSRCAVHALRVWLDAANIHRGAVCRRMHRGDTIGQDRLTDQSVALIIKRRGQAAGISPEDLSGHSLRAGYGRGRGRRRRGAQDRQRHASQEPPRAAQVHPRRHGVRRRRRSPVAPPTAGGRPGWARSSSSSSSSSSSPLPAGRRRALRREGSCQFPNSPARVAECLQVECRGPRTSRLSGFLCAAGRSDLCSCARRRGGDWTSSWRLSPSGGSPLP